MIKNIITMTLRCLGRRKGIAIINIAGLTLGLTLVILIAGYVQYEYSYDTFHENMDRICRAEQEWRFQNRFLAFTPPPLGPVLVDHYPEIEAFVRMLNMGERQLIARDSDRIYEGRGWWAESAFFDFFNFRLIQGDPAHALDDPFSIVLSQDLAGKFFPDANPIGQTLRFNDQFDCRVTGIIENCPANTSIRYRYLLSFSSYQTIAGNDYFNNWNNLLNFTYVRIADKTDLNSINEKIRDVIKTHWRNELDIVTYLEPMSRFHFHTRSIGSIGARGDKNKILAFSAIGLFILLIACFNYMNLATAQAARRAREIGLRKMVGASRKSLIWQFEGESLFFALAALVCAALLARLLLSVVNDLIGLDLTLDYFRNRTLTLGICGTAILTGIISGSYPAFYLSALRPVDVLRGTIVPHSGRGAIRKFLVMFQFIISISLIVGTLTIRRQLHYLRTKDLGYTKEHIVTMGYRKMDPQTLSRYNAFKTELLKIPSVAGVTESRHLPTEMGYSAVPVGDWEGATEGEHVFLHLNPIDEHFIEVYGITLIAGRNITAVDRQENAAVCILNETAVKAFGWEVDSAIGKRVTRDFRVIGVIRDFHKTSFREAIPPLSLQPVTPPRPGTRARHQLSVRISPDAQKATLERISRLYARLFPNDLFEYQFFDETLDWLYSNEERTFKLIGHFSLLAIFIGCLGLVGLTTFTIEQKTREIGIRKVLGAPTPRLLFQLSKGYMKWILIANGVAWPASYLALTRWLSSFAYRSGMTPWIFSAGTLIVLLVAMLTVSVQTVKAATARPVKSLKVE